MAEIVCSFPVIKETSPRLQIITSFSNTENQNVTGEMDMAFLLNLTL
jgi:hypothetical protein